MFCNQIIYAYQYETNGRIFAGSIFVPQVIRDGGFITNYIKEEILRDKFCKIATTSGLQIPLANITEELSDDTIKQVIDIVSEYCEYLQRDEVKADDDRVGG